MLYGINHVFFVMFQMAVLAGVIFVVLLVILVVVFTLRRFRRRVRDALKDPPRWFPTRSASGAAIARKEHEYQKVALHSQPFFVMNLIVVAILRLNLVVVTTTT
jgi:Ca2+/Na+ antiporter